MLRFSSIFAAVLLATSVLADGLNPNLQARDPGRPRPRPGRKPLVNSHLQRRVTLPALMSHAQAFEDIAFATSDRNRYVGTAGHNNTVSYIVDKLNSLGGYYDVSTQSFSLIVYLDGEHSLSAEGEDLDSNAFTYSPNGNVDDVPVKVNNLGCEPEDFPEAVAGHIALISRGTCQFGLKVALAGAANAAAVIIYNNIEGNIQGTLSDPVRPEGPYVAALSVTQAMGLDWVAKLDAGETVSAHVTVEGSSLTTSFTENVIAETKRGDHDNVLHLGAHADSVFAGPGINDNGSGSIGLLEVASQLSNFTVRNAVRFSWWGAEEEGLVGSEYYISQLPEEERMKIRLYLNFDMIASPNYVLAAYDGDGDVFNITGPPGSAEAEAFFHDYYRSAGVPFTTSPFSGRSDYGPFLEVGIPCGGLDTGAEGIKTEEEAAIFGGTAGMAYDPNYHAVGDTVANLAQDAFEVNAKGMAAAVTRYARSWHGMPEREPVATSFRKTSEEASMWKGDLLIA